ncbi:hypothetical protein D9M72_508620 [compost metagenome]
MRCAAAQDRGDRRRALPKGDFIRQAVQGPEHLFLGPGEVQTDLRLPMQFVAEPGNFALQFPGIGGDRHVLSSFPNDW